MSQNDLSYRRTAIEGASSIGLMIALFDTLVGDFRRAAAALREDDIETRRRELNHAALVLGQLQNWLDMEKGGESAQTLAHFYLNLRAKTIEAAIAKSAEILESQIDMILEVRAAWQLLDGPSVSLATEQVEAAPRGLHSPMAPATEPGTDRVRFSQSA